MRTEENPFKSSMDKGRMLNISMKAIRAKKWKNYIWIFIGLLLLAAVVIWIGILDRLPRKVKVVIYQSTLTPPSSPCSVFYFIYFDSESCPPAWACSCPLSMCPKLICMLQV